MILNCVIIGTDRELGTQLQTAFSELGGVNVMRELVQYPHEFELLRTMRSIAPPILFLGLQDKVRSFEIIHTLQTEFPALQIAAFHDDPDPKLLRKLMQQGVREFLVPPFEEEDLAEVLIRLRDAADKTSITVERSNLVYSFLPSKPGSGTTTLAVNASLAMASHPDTPCLLMDLDLNSGLIRFLLKLENEHTILDAATHAADMDEALWPQLVSSVGNLDVLHTAQITLGVRIEAASIRSLVDYSRKNYKAICVDLSGNMEKYANEVMHESKKIFIVCTPEIPSLHLAREKFEFLKANDLGDKVSFLLNRQSQNDLIDQKSIQQILGAPITMAFPNDYRGVSSAVAEGKGIATKSPLGIQLRKFSYHLLDRPIPATVEQAKSKEFRSIIDLFKFGLSRLTFASNSANKS